MNKCRLGAASLVVLALGGCADQKAQTIVADARPAITPIASTTVFSGALSCLDSMLARKAGKTTDIIVGQMPDSTGKFALSMRDMTIHAITTANTRSGAFRVIDQPQVIPAGIKVAHPPLDTAPTKVSASSYNLAGSIISASPSLYNENFSLGLGLAGTNTANAGFAVIGQLGTAATGMRLSRRGTNETLYSSQHEIVLQKSEVGFDARVGFASYGASAGVSFDEQDSSAKAIQTMVELHVLELLGRAANVPYWECLSKPAADPKTAVIASTAWEGDGDTERRDFIAKGLKTLGYAAGLDKALQQFQIDHGLTPTGRVNYESYLAVREQLEAAGGTPEARESNITIRARNLQRRRQHWRLEIGLKKSAFVRCYYRADDGVIAMIYPNRYDKARWLAANTTHFVPSTSTEKIFNIGAAAPQFLCISMADDPERELPAALKLPDFRDLRETGVTSLRDVLAAYSGSIKGEISYAVWPR